jgi:hypothetical protein
MYLETKESPEKAYQELHSYIHHAHINDDKKE